MEFAILDIVVIEEICLIAPLIDLLFLSGFRLVRETWMVNFVMAIPNSAAKTYHQKSAENTSTNAYRSRSSPLAAI